MARYINKDKFIAQIQDNFCTECNNYDGVKCRSCGIDDTIEMVENADEADVVPKSEVERLENTYSRAVRKADKKAIVAIQNAKQEVAREIFGEIEKIRMIERALYKRGVEGCYNSDSDYAELKKKYIGESDVKRDTV